jgi:hypothetical protein
MTGCISSLVRWFTSHGHYCVNITRQTCYNTHVYNSSHVCTSSFLLGGGGGLADPDNIYILQLILKIMLHKSCRKYSCNITLLAAAFICIRISLHVPGPSHTALSPFLTHLYLFFKILICYLSAYFSGWFRLKGKLRKTFDIILIAKPFWGGGVRKIGGGCSPVASCPPLEAPLIPVG